MVLINGVSSPKNSIYKIWVPNVYTVVLNNAENTGTVTSTPNLKKAHGNENKTLCSSEQSENSMVAKNGPKS